MYRLFCFLTLLSVLHCVQAQTYQEQLNAIHSSVTQQKDGKSFYVHIVKKGQTLYMISKAYGVDVNDIIEENPVVKEGLKADQKLLIPFPLQKKEDPSAKPETVNRKPEPGSQKLETGTRNPETGNQKPETGTRKPEPASSVIPCGSDTSALHKQYNVVLILPLYLEEVEAMNPETATEETIDNWNSLKYLPFYEGFRLAVDSLQKQGLHLLIHVYDLAKDSLKTQQLLKKDELRSADLIIGLLFNKNFQAVAKFARDHKIPIVNPLSERSDVVVNNEMVFKANPSRSTQIESLADFMQKSMYRGQIIIIRNGQFKDKDIADKLKKECLGRNLNVILAEGQDVAIGKLSKGKENVVVAFADNNAYALDLMRRFYELRNDYNLNLIGLTDWEKIEGLETDFLNGLSTHLVSPCFVDYTDKGVKTLVQRYQQVYKADPGSLSFQGFDVGYYFLSALMKFGKNFPSCIQDYRQKTSQTSFEFRRAGNNASNGFENRHWSVYKYESFKLVRVN
ncbi:MAG: LysM peptidoglycan-binding domain-containing protein [Bacteroidetes bacterium]|nr:LysM peptidoglycan-binding domain-containing protein [Bacteroidota bacterium]